MKFITHIPCIVRVLNIIVQSALTKIENEIHEISRLVYFIVFSAKRKPMLEKCCSSVNMKHLALIGDIPVRWNSIYLTLERAIQTKKILNCP